MIKRAWFASALTALASTGVYADLEPFRFCDVGRNRSGVCVHDRIYH